MWWEIVALCGYKSSIERDENLPVGYLVGHIVGYLVGQPVGYLVGDLEGLDDGDADGPLLGLFEGVLLGLFEGDWLGFEVGCNDEDDVSITRQEEWVLCVVWDDGSKIRYSTQPRDKIDLINTAYSIHNRHSPPWTVIPLAPPLDLEAKGSDSRWAVRKMTRTK